MKLFVASDSRNEVQIIHCCSEKSLEKASYTSESLNTCFSPKSSGGDGVTVTSLAALFRPVLGSSSRVSKFEMLKIDNSNY
jgi:hypothetical protein